MKKIILAALIIAALYTLSNNVFAQDLPAFVVTVKGEMCSGLISGADVYIYDYVSGTQLAFGETNTYGSVDLGPYLSGACPFQVNIIAYYPSRDDTRQMGQRYNVTRTCINASYDICLGPQQKLISIYA